MKKSEWGMLKCCLIVFIFICAQDIYGQNQTTDISGNNLNRVLIMIDQSYVDCEPYENTIRLPIEDIATKLFKYAEADIILPGTGDYNATIKIEIEGKAGGTYYYPEGYLYTGAYLSGKVTLASKAFSCEKRFDVYINSPSLMGVTWNPLSPCDAPFDRAFYLSGSVVSRLLEIIYNTYGINPVISALRDDHKNVQNIAIETLVNIGKPAVDHLIAAMYDEDPDVKRGSIDALGKIGDNYAVEDIIVALKDIDPSIRWRAAKALGKLGSKRAVEPLIAILADANKIVRLQAVKSLGYIGDPFAVEPLIAVIKSDDPGIQSYAKDSLKIINNKNLNKLTMVE